MLCAYLAGNFIYYMTRFLCQKVWEPFTAHFAVPYCCHYTNSWNSLYYTENTKGMQAIFTYMTWKIYHYTPKRHTIFF